MKVVGSFNKVSEKLKKELIKPVKNGEIVHLQLLNGSYDPTLKRECFGASKAIRLSDTIYDPYAKGNEKDGYEGEFVDIGVPEIIKDGRVEKCKKFWVDAIANGVPGNGNFELIGGNINEMQVYEFLCISNKNGRNPYRDTSKNAEYEIVDTEAIIKQEKEQAVKELRNKLNRLVKENPEEAKSILENIKLPKKEAETN